MCTCGSGVAREGVGLSGEHARDLDRLTAGGWGARERALVGWGVGAAGWAASAAAALVVVPAAAPACVRAVGW